MSHRTFKSPSGRLWTAGLVEMARVTPAEPVQEVLRFVSGDLALDLDQWPENWATFSDTALVELVRCAKPPRLGLPVSGTS